MMEIVGPYSVESIPVFFRRKHDPPLVPLILGDHQSGTWKRVQIVGDLAQQMHRRLVDDGVSRIEAQSVDVVLVRPVERVVAHESANGPAVRSVVVDPVAPRRLVSIGEKLSAGDCRQVVASRTEVIVDDIEDDAEVAGMCGVDESLERLWSAVRCRWSVEQYAVVPPVARAGEAGDRHDLDCGDAQGGEGIELSDRRIEGAFGGKGPDVQLIDDEII